MSDDVVELRGLIPRKVAAVLDAVAMARRDSTNKSANRMDIACEVLTEYANLKAHEASIVMRVLKGNGSKADSGGGEA